MSPRLFACLLLIAGAPALATAQSRGGDKDKPHEPADAVAELAAWRKRVANPKQGIDAASQREIERIVADLRMLQVAVPERRAEVFLALLDLATLLPKRPAGTRAAWEAPDPRAAAVELAFAALERSLEIYQDADLGGWIAREILAQPQTHSIERRRAALDLLAGKRPQSALLGIMSCSVDPAPEVREAAMRALVGWDDDSVHAWMVARLAESKGSPSWAAANLARKHFSGVVLREGSAGSKALFEFLREDVFSEDWRTASRALQLLPPVEHALAMPALIEALSIWKSRADEGRGSKRIEGEIHAALKSRSRANVGPFPELWALWWKAHAAEMGKTGVTPDEDQVTRASFFGLRPITDRVTFILDRSGSMAGDFAHRGTRFGEAIRQMMAFLRDLGPKTKFRVVLFDDEARVWKDSLQLATPDNLGSAEIWAGYQRPDGGTMLRQAVERVLRLKPDGKIDLRRLEEDTVIILCDGATTDGSSWVEPLLERVGLQACVVFHCVELGTEGDGTLEKLARLTGGEYRRVDG